MARDGVMTPADKVALLLLNLEPEVQKRVLAEMGPEHQDQLRARIQSLEKSPPSVEAVDEVLSEFERLLREPPPPEPPPPEPPPPAAETEETRPVQKAEAPPPVQDQGDPLGAVRLLGPDRLATVLQAESPRTAALVLNYLDAARGGEVLKRLPGEMRKEISTFLGKAPTVSIDVVQRIARAILLKSQAIREAPAETAAAEPVKKMADLLRYLDKPERMEMLAVLDEKDPETAARVKELLYQFEDLLLIEDRSMQKLLSEVDSKNLATALKGASDAIKEKVLNNLSKRARETLGEEMEFLGSVPTPQVQAAQKAIVDVIQRLDQAGELVMTE